MHDLINLYERPRVSKFRDRKGLGRSRNGMLVFNGESISVWEDAKIREMDGGDGCTEQNIVPLSLMSQS